VAGTDALFLDLDGTLAPLVPRPDDTILAISLRRLLIRLQRTLSGRLAIVSGRTIAVVDRIISIPSLAIAGVHGLERRGADGRVTRVTPGAGLDAARRDLSALVEQHPRILLEDKGASLALHFRMAPEMETIAATAAETAASGHGLELQPGKMVFEVREPGPDKGAALAAFMTEAPFAAGRPIFVGDDVTDESAFAAAAGLGGHGILVGQPRPSAAAFRLDDVADVERWLAESAAMMGAA
jgi:trehalose 6-phosphate phosphatase